MAMNVTRWRTEPIREFRGTFWFLSNFASTVIEYEGLRFGSVEHAYQAAKTLRLDLRVLIQQQATPAGAKHLGQKLNLRPDWESVKLPIMLDLLRQKFAPNSALAAWLDDTGDAPLIEGNDWDDTFWGSCRGTGLNWLGRLLEHVRDENRHGKRLHIVL